MTGRRRVSAFVGHDVLGPRWRLVPLPAAVGLIVGEYVLASDARSLVAQLNRLQGGGRNTLTVFTEEDFDDPTDALASCAPHFSTRVLTPTLWQSHDEGAASVVRAAIEDAAEHDIIALLWPLSMSAVFATLVHRAKAGELLGGRARPGKDSR